MTLVDAVGALVCGWFAVQWGLVALLFTRTHRYSEAALAMLATANAFAIFLASLLISIPPDTVEGGTVRAPAAFSMILCFAVLRYVRLKAAGQLPVAGA